MVRKLGPNEEGPRPDDIELTQRSDGKFGILNEQKEPIEPPSLHETPLTNIPQPTQADLSDVPASKKSQAKKEGDVSSALQKNTPSPIESLAFEPIKLYTPPKEVLDYVEDLIATKRPIKYVQFILQNAHSPQELRAEIEKYTQEGKFTPQEYAHMMRFFGEKVEEPKDPFGREKYVPSEKLVAYVQKLLQEGKNVRSLELEIENSYSKEQLQEKLKHAELMDRITKEEYDEMVVILEDRDPLDAQLEINVDNELNEARSQYAEELLKWKEKLRKDKNVFAKTLSDLGIEKQMPNKPKTVDLLDAEERYMDAKRMKRKAILKASEKLQVHDKKGEVVDEFTWNEKAFEAAEKEYDELQKTISESLPPLEKGILTKSLETFSKLTPLQKRLFSAALVTTGAVLTGGLNGGFTLAKTGARLATGAVFGATLAPKISQAMDKGFQKLEEKRAEKRKSKYGIELTEENFAEKEKELMASFDKEENKKKRERLYKAGGLMAAGAVVGGMTNMAVDSMSHSLASAVPLPETSPIPDTPSVPQSEVSHVPQAELPTLPDAPDILHDPLPVAAVAPENLTPEHFMPDTKAAISSRGFIQSFVDMKAKIIEQYDGIQNVPEATRELLSKSPVDLAKEFNFYDPEKHLSALGLKGESLVMDPQGSLFLEHVDGSKEMLFDAAKGEVHQFQGTMQNVLDVPESQDVNVELGPTPPDLNAGAEIPIVDAPLEAHPIPETTILKVVAPQEVLPPVDFEGGKIQIVKAVENQKELQVLLNGKAIASGVLTDRGPKLELFSNLKSGWFSPDNAFERAFKQASQLIKSNKIIT